MQLKLHIWRQPGPKHAGRMATYVLNEVSEHMSFLEMLDVLNSRLIEGDSELLRFDKHASKPEPWVTEPVAFDHDCREGICGSCGIVINGFPHGPHARTTTCQLHMRSFQDGQELSIEPWRSEGFPVMKDLIVDRSAFDRIVQAGGYISAPTGSAPDANATLIPKALAEQAMDAAECIGCGACVAACPNASAMLFTAAKVAHLGSVPQGQAERHQRVQRMVHQMEQEQFGSCTNHGECEKACPKAISLDFIAKMNSDLLCSQWRALLGGTQS